MTVCYVDRDSLTFIDPRLAAHTHVTRHVGWYWSTGTRDTGGGGGGGSTGVC